MSVYPSSQFGYNLTCKMSHFCVLLWSQKDFMSTHSMVIFHCVIVKTSFSSFFNQWLLLCNSWSSRLCGCILTNPAMTWVNGSTSERGGTRNNKFAYFSNLNLTRTAQNRSGTTPIVELSCRESERYDGSVLTPMTRFSGSTGSEPNRRQHYLYSYWDRRIEAKDERYDDRHSGISWKIFRSPYLFIFWILSDTGLSLRKIAFNMCDWFHMPRSLLDPVHKNSFSASSIKHGAII